MRTMICMHRSVLAFLAVAAALASPRPAAASVVLATPLPDLVKLADDVNVADVVSVQSSWDQRHERIYSIIQLRVVEAWKGKRAAGELVTIYQPGGTVGDVTQIVVGLASFEPGERTLVFLRGPRRQTVVGLAQGKRGMHRDAAGGWIVAGADLAGAELVPQTGQSLPAPTGPQKLDELRAHVHQLMSGAAR